MEGRNTVEKVLCLSAEWGYTVFYRNHEDNNVLSDIVVAHPISIAMIRMWPYILIMDTTYNMPLLEAVGMTPTDKIFTVATVFMQCDGRGGQDPIGVCGGWVEDIGAPVS
ncbi:hypothetical protein M9H77_17634 [Catharanthus roseus]|uniref:Uncharacterized protein n=1 Tax=Catharanthus roseus TaxID=4058 RepID=A0ACC0B570_CATRO|nr:hypothetical protein M9H77_17634 [Catharanthus roseus]